MSPRLASRTMECHDLPKAEAMEIDATGDVNSARTNGDVCIYTMGYAHASPQNCLFWGPGFGTSFCSIFGRFLLLYCLLGWRLRCNASRLLRMCWSSRGLPRRFLAPFNASSEKWKTPIENMGERVFRMDAVWSKAHVMFEASRLHSLSEAGAHKPFFSITGTPLFAVEAVLDQFSGRIWDSSSIFDVLLWVTFPWFLGFRCECAGFVEA